MIPLDLFRHLLVMKATAAEVRAAVVTVGAPTGVTVVILLLAVETPRLMEDCRRESRR